MMRYHYPVLQEELGIPFHQVRRYIYYRRWNGEGPFRNDGRQPCSDGSLSGNEARKCGGNRVRLEERGYIRKSGFRFRWRQSGVGTFLRRRVHPLQLETAYELNYREGRW